MKIKFTTKKDYLYGVIRLFFIILGCIAMQIIDCILDIIISPWFGMKIRSVSVFGFIFCRDNKKWKVSFHRFSLICQCNIVADLSKTIPEDSLKREKQMEYLKRVLAVLICLLMLFEFRYDLSVWRLAYKEGVLLQNWLVAVSRNSVLMGMFYFSVFKMGITIYVFEVSTKRMTGYTYRAINKLQQGYSLEELNLKPIEKLPFKKILLAEKLMYYYVYVYFLLAVGYMEELDKVSEEITGLLETSAYDINYIGLYYWLVYYYSKYYVDYQRADQFLKMAWPVLSKDSNADAKRVLAQYYYGIQGDVVLARQYLIEGLACVENFSIGGEREMEKRLLGELEEELYDKN